jgi:UDP-glucose:(heptosyl)LPS alpha-1,3-glucosyltransferase
MNLGIVRRCYAHASGAELYVQRLLKELLLHGHTPHLLTEHWPNAPEGTHVHLLAGSTSRKERSTVFAEAVSHQLQSLRLDCVLSLERTLKQDVFRAGDGVHLSWLSERRRFAPWWKKPWIGRGQFHQNLLRLEAAVLNPDNTRHIIVNSLMVREEILHHYGFPEHRIHLIRNGVDSHKMADASRDLARSRYGIQDDESVIVFVGSGWERKGLPFLLRAFSLLPRDMKVRLLVAGKGTPPFRPPNNVRFLGSIQEVETVYAAADLLVTLPIYEPCANVVVEALASGIPVITTKKNGAAEMFDAGFPGAAVENPADPQAVATALVHWLRSGYGRQRPSEQTLQELSIARNTRETLELLQNVAPRPNPPRRPSN